MLDKVYPFRNNFLENGNLFSMQNIPMNRFCGLPEFIPRRPRGASESEISRLPFKSPASVRTSMNLRAKGFKKEKRAMSAYKPRVPAMEQAFRILLCLGASSYPERDFSGKKSTSIE
jgi:hypothetical protein